MATGTVKSLIHQSGTATNETSVGGETLWERIGSIVTITGTITTSAQKSAGTALVSSIPKAATNNGAIIAQNNNAVNSYYYLDLTNLGQINVASTALPSGVSLRFCCSYVCID